MIINTHNKTCCEQQRLESTNSNREQQTSHLATLFVLIFNDGRRIHNNNMKMSKNTQYSQRNHLREYKMAQNDLL